MSNDMTISTVLGRREWIITDGCGGYAMGSWDTKLRRRYHSYYTVANASLDYRINVLGFTDESISYENVDNAFVCIDSVFLNSAEFYYINGTNISQDTVCIEQVIVIDNIKYKIQKKISLLASNGCKITYSFNKPLHKKINLVVRPVLFLRNHHELHCFYKEQILNISHENIANWILKTDLFNLGSLSFRMDVSQVSLVNEKKYYNLFYEFESERGYDFEEKICSQFAFNVNLEPNSLGFSFLLVAKKEEIYQNNEIENEKLLLQNFNNMRNLIDNEKYISQHNEIIWLLAQKIARNSAQFLVKTSNINGIIAGYPWFSMWARDTFIAMPGLCFTTKRFSLAKEIIEFYAKHLNKGLIPNFFFFDNEHQILEKDYTHVDGTLWYLYATAKYVEYTEDKSFINSFLPIIEEIIDWHIKGTHNTIHVDYDGLIYAGFYGTPLTWMNSVHSDTPITLRSGKPIEVNALWISSLRKWAKFAKLVSINNIAKKFNTLADKANDAFQKYWDANYGWFADVLDSPSHYGYSPDLSLRPNQIIALSFSEIDISLDKRQRALEAIEHNLLSPVGLRTLSKNSPFYKGSCSGGIENQLCAMHQGASRSWLLGFYIAALRLAYGDEANSKIINIYQNVIPFLGRDCAEHFAEFYDSEFPYIARGCPANALNSAEILRSIIENYFEIKPNGKSMEKYS